MKIFGVGFWFEKMKWKSGKEHLKFSFENPILIFNKKYGIIYMVEKDYFAEAGFLALLWPFLCGPYMY